MAVAVTTFRRFDLPRLVLRSAILPSPSDAGGVAAALPCAQSRGLSLSKPKAGISDDRDLLQSTTRCFITAAHRPHYAGHGLGIATVVMLLAYAMVWRAIVNIFAEFGTSFLSCFRRSTMQPVQKAGAQIRLTLDDVDCSRPISADHPSRPFDKTRSCSSTTHVHHERQRRIPNTSTSAL